VLFCNTSIADSTFSTRTHLEQRRRMIQAWANLLDRLAAGKMEAVSKDLRDTASTVL
jgi:hypothetical protein